MKKFTLLIIVLLLISSFGIYRYNMHLESEKEWMKINYEYKELTYKIEHCIKSCELEDELIPCFNNCDNMQDAELNRIGIMHDTWRNRYVN